MSLFPESSLYLITDRQLARGRSTPEVVQAALAGGVDVVQLRDKMVESVEMVEDGLRLHDLTAQAGKPLIVNDRLDVALVLDAEGAHVGQTDIPAAMARSVWARPKILGVSTSGPEMAQRAYRCWRGLRWLWAALSHPQPSRRWPLPGGLDMLPQVLEVRTDSGGRARRYLPR